MKKKKIYLTASWNFQFYGFFNPFYKKKKKYYYTYSLVA